MSNESFHLSVVATSRNDNHGKNLLYRMQKFIDGFIEQCKRHHLKAELILVEWNPPDDALSLAKALCYPQDKGPCVVRIIRVPKEIHLKFDHADKIPLFQMIGKNVGIRRALGKFVLATNIDIIFSDQLIDFMKKKLAPGSLYRVDRLDIPEKLPLTDSFDEILRYCSKNFFRINGRVRTTIIDKEKPRKKLQDWIKLLYKTSSWLYKTILHCLKSLSCISLMTIFTKTVPFLVSFSVSILNRRKRLIKISKKLLCFVYPQNSRILHTNACGDFTLLSLDDWKQLRGYPEWPIFSWHIDSALLYQARQHGVKFRNLSKPIYHIEHETGSGYSPEGAFLLFHQLDLKGVPYLSNADLKNIVSDLANSKHKAIYNPENWGMADLVLEEFIV